MTRSRQIRLTVAAFGVLLLSGCGIVDPCPEIGVDIGMSGRWSLFLVNGQSIPSSGYPLPTGTDRLTLGDMNFKALGDDGGSCEDNDLTQNGRVVAVYTLVNSSGQPKPSKAYAGSYTYESKTGTVILKAFNKSVTGDRFGNEFTIRPSIPLFGTYVLTFRFSP